MLAIDRILSDLAARHHGLVRRRDALAAGVDPNAIDRRVAAGALVAVARGLYRHPAHPWTWEANVLAAVWRGGRDAIASHNTAAWLHGLDGARKGVIEISVPHRRNVRVDGVRVHERRVPLEVGDRVEIDAIPCTGLVRTLVDLAWWRGLARSDEALDGLQRRGVVSDLSALGQDLERRRGRGRTRSGKLSERVAQRVGAQPTTRLERRFLTLVRRAGLPEPQCQYAVEIGPRLTIHVDFAFVEQRVAVETDGRLGHAADADRQRDHERDALLAERGWKVRRFTYRDVLNRPEYVVARLRAALFPAP